MSRIRHSKNPAEHQPTFVEPMAAKAVTELPIGDDWLYEAKLDGYRVLALKTSATVRLLSRNNKDLTRDFSHIATAVSRITAQTALFEGEIVAVDAAGVPRFQLLQHRSTRPSARSCTTRSIF